MTVPWEVEVQVAGHSWTVTNLDPATPGPAAPLQLTHAVPDDQLWPAQPLPMSASFGLVVPDAAELSDVVQGATVWVSFTAPPNPTPVTFAGNLSDVDIEPVRFKPDPDSPEVAGVRFNITALGYLALLAEELVTVTETGGPVSPRLRMDSLFTGWEDTDDGAPWLSPEYPPGWNWSDFNHFPVPLLRELAIVGEALGPHLDRLLRMWLWDHDDTGQLERLVVEPIINPVTHEHGDSRGFTPYTAHWQLVRASNRVPLTPTGELVNGASGWRVSVDGTLSASVVERSVRFVQRKGANVSKVVVPYYYMPDNKDHIISATNGAAPTVQHSLDIPLLYINNSGDKKSRALPIAAFYLPPAAHADTWGVETVTWRLAVDSPGQIPPELGELVVIAPIPDTQHPAGRSWIQGLVRGWTLTVPDMTVDLTLGTAQGAIVPGGPQLTWAQLPAGATWAQLDPDDTWTDYDHLRGL